MEHLHEQPHLFGSLVRPQTFQFICLVDTRIRVRRGVASQHPKKYVLDDQELERVSAIARIELEDARKELEKAHKAAQSMGKGAEGDEADDADEDDESAWVE